MLIAWDDIQWMREHQPRLKTGLDAPSVIGVLEISAYYEKNAQGLVTGRRSAIGHQCTFVEAEFPIDIQLNNRDENGWPKVCDIAQLHRQVAKQYRLRIPDLHFYPDGHACLGFTYPWDPPLTLRQFIAALVEPFFYRLAYVDLYGLKAAKTDLWPEYSHGRKGHREHALDVQRGQQYMTEAAPDTPHLH